MFWPLPEKNSCTHAFFCNFVNSSYHTQVYGQPEEWLRLLHADENQSSISLLATFVNLSVMAAHYHTIAISSIQHQGSASGSTSAEKGRRTGMLLITNAVIWLERANSFPWTKDRVKIHQTPFPRERVGSGHETMPGCVRTLPVRLRAMQLNCLRHFCLSDFIPAKTRKNFRHFCYFSQNEVLTVT